MDDITSPLCIERKKANQTYYPVARTRGRVISVSVGMFVCLFLCLFVCGHKNEQLSETGQFMSSTYCGPVRNRNETLASTYLTNESVRQGAKKSRRFGSLKISF